MDTTLQRIILQMENQKIKQKDLLGKAEAIAQAQQKKKRTTSKKKKPAEE